MQQLPWQEQESIHPFGVLQEKSRNYGFKRICEDNRPFCSTPEMPKCLVFHGFASLGIRFFEPGGREFGSSNLSGRTIINLHALFFVL